MFLCKKFIDRKMFSFGGFLESVENVLAPAPTLIQDFEYHWKLIKSFHANKNNDETRIKIHINDTNLPFHLEQMLEILIKEQNTLQTEQEEASTSSNRLGECMEFILNNRPLDILVELAVDESPVGCRQLVLSWIKRYLSCIPEPHLDHASIFQNCIKLVQNCVGTLASPYELDEILFLETLAGLVRKDPILLNLFIPAHQHSHQMMNGTLKGVFQSKEPKANKLFECTSLEPNIRRISLVAEDGRDKPAEENNIYENCQKTCDCDADDRFTLLDAIVSYIESADSTIVVRSCEGALILTSLDGLDRNCAAIRSSLSAFSEVISAKLSMLAEQIPDDIDLGDIEEAVVTWGLFPKDNQQPHFIGRYQLTSFLCWLDYCDCLIKESVYLAEMLSRLLRKSVLEKIIEPQLIDTTAAFALVLSAKIVKQVRSEAFLNEIATWLVGSNENSSDCLLSILLDIAQDNSDILLQTLQFVESLLDNPNERILHSMLFFYLKNRGYHDRQNQSIECWSDEEDNREKRRGSIEKFHKSRTLAPNNILKIINNFLLLLPRQLMNESVGTCYEEYMQDASHHYQSWIKKTEKFNWPIEATWPSDLKPVDNDRNPLKISPSQSLGLSTNLKFNSPVDEKKIEIGDYKCSDSGISEEEQFYEGPLLRLLFNQVKNMASQPYELNLAAIAILSKLALLPHPYLHEILLNTEIPVAHGAVTLWTVLQQLARKLLSEIPRIPNFAEKIRETAKRLLTNPPLMKEDDETAEVSAVSPKEEKTNPDEDPSLEALIVLEEFCKELAAIAFIKYHHATE